MAMLITDEPPRQAPHLSGNEVWNKAEKAIPGDTVTWISRKEIALRMGATRVTSEGLPPALRLPRRMYSASRC